MDLLRPIPYNSSIISYVSCNLHRDNRNSYFCYSSSSRSFLQITSKIQLSYPSSIIFFIFRLSASYSVSSESLPFLRSQLLKKKNRQFPNRVLLVTDFLFFFKKYNKQGTNKKHQRTSNILFVSRLAEHKLNCCIPKFQTSA